MIFNIVVDAVVREVLAEVCGLRKKRLLRVGILWKCQVLTGRRFFGEWYTVML